MMPVNDTEFSCNDKMYCPPLCEVCLETSYNEKLTRNPYFLTKNSEEILYS